MIVMVPLRAALGAARRMSGVARRFAPRCLAVATRHAFRAPAAGGVAQRRGAAWRRRHPVAAGLEDLRRTPGDSGVPPLVSISPKNTERRSPQSGHLVISRSATILDGQLLIAMPAWAIRASSAPPICMSSHSSEGAMGIQSTAGRQHRYSLVVRLRHHPEGRARSSYPKMPRLMQVLKGGPVDSGRGFVLIRAILHPGRDAEHRRRRLPDRDGGHAKAIAKGNGPKARDPGARLRPLGARPARERDPARCAGRLRCDADRGFRLRPATSTKSTSARCARAGTSISACCRTRPGTRSFFYQRSPHPQRRPGLDPGPIRRSSMEHDVAHLHDNGLPDGGGSQRKCAGPTIVPWLVLRRLC